MRLREIERLRGVAILLVLLVHASFLFPYTSLLLQGTWSGVDLFFVISGFVVTLSLEPQLGESAAAGFSTRIGAARDTLKTFYVRRVYRLLPMALFVFAVQLTLVLSVRGTTNTFGTVRDVFYEAALVLSGTYNYVLASIPQPRMSVFWSLCVEEHFYLLVPVLFILAGTRDRRIRLSVIVIALIALVVRPLTPNTEPYVIGRFRSHLRFDSLMAGVFLALLTLRKRSSPSPEPSRLRLPGWLYKFALVPAIVVLIAILPARMGDALTHRWGFVPLWFLSAVLVAWAARDRDLVLGFPLVGHALEWVGARSYAMYLLHWTLFGTTMEIADRTGWEPTTEARAWCLFAICVAVTCIASDVAHRWIERPFMAAGRARVEAWKRKETPRGGAVSWRTPAAVLAILAPLAIVWVPLLARASGAPVWSGEYFAGTSLEGPAVRQDTSSIDFYWGERAPLPNVPLQFSARFMTCLRLDHDTDVQLDLGSDDGSSLRIDEQLVLDGWRVQGYTVASTTAHLRAGVHLLRVEYFNGSGQETLTLRAGFDGAHPTAFPAGTLSLPHGSRCDEPAH